MGSPSTEDGERAVQILLDNPGNVLRKAIDDLLPISIINREKQVFRTPYASWRAGELKDFVLERIANGSLLQAILWPDKLKTLIEGFERDPRRVPS